MVGCGIQLFAEFSGVNTIMWETINLFYMKLDLKTIISFMYVWYVSFICVIVWIAIKNKTVCDFLSSDK